MINYSRYRPEWIDRIAATAPMQRLREVGMNCGCEYTQFPQFKNLPTYSRYEHSIGAALIVWNFTQDKTQAVAALLHDIATPVFAHTIDFLNGDYLTQESTEDRTKEIIKNSVELRNEFELERISAEDVTDYHRYPIADNDSPRLSSDRLEYTIGNAERYNFASRDRCQELYDALVVTKAEDGREELAFQDLESAELFTEISLACSNIYTADEDRYAMQILSELISVAINKKVLSPEDLYTTEPEVIRQLRTDEETAALWEHFCSLSRMVYDEDGAPEKDRRIIAAKKRYIDPIIIGRGRVSDNSERIREYIDAYLARNFDSWICGL